MCNKLSVHIFFGQNFSSSHLNRSSSHFHIFRYSHFQIFAFSPIQICTYHLSILTVSHSHIGVYHLHISIFSHFFFLPLFLSVSHISTYSIFGTFSLLMKVIHTHTHLSVCSCSFSGHLSSSSNFLSFSCPTRMGGPGTNLEKSKNVLFGHGKTEFVRVVVMKQSNET